MDSWKDHRNRWITGVVGLIVTSLIVGYGSRPIFFLFILLINLLVLKEFYDLSSSTHGSRLVGIVLGIILSGSFFALNKSALIAVLAGIGFYLCLFFIINFQNSSSPHTDFKKHLVGIFIIAFLLSHLIWLRDLKEGKLWIFFLLAVVFTGDTFALYGGKMFGHHQLSPRISAGKTIEGALFGIIGSLVGGLFFSLFFFTNFSKIIIVLLSIILGILGQLGDLWESALKREAKVKDSGWLLPGHGGFLDRVDSILFTAPFLYYFILF